MLDVLLDFLSGISRPFPAKLLLSSPANRFPCPSPLPARSNCFTGSLHTRWVDRKETPRRCPGLRARGLHKPGIPSSRPLRGLRCLMFAGSLVTTGDLNAGVRSRRLALAAKRPFEKHRSGEHVTSATATRGPLGGLPFQTFQPVGKT